MRNKIFSIACGIAIFAIANTAFAATVYVDPTAVGAGNGTTQADAYTDLGAAISAVTTLAGDEIQVFGTLPISSTVAVNKQVIIRGMSGAEITVTGGSYVLNITALGTEVRSLKFNKTDATDQNMVLVNANDVVIDGNEFIGTYNLGDGQVTRGLEIAGITNVTINGNTFTHLRQPAYINGATGSVTNNTVNNTKGFVIVSNSNLTITGNTFSTNIGDIAIICPTAVASNATCPDANNYTDILNLSNSNNGAVVDKQVPVKDNATLSVVYVDSAVAVSGNGTEGTPYKTITEAIAKVESGGQIWVKAGSYTENLTINKPLTLSGNNGNINPVDSFRATESIITGSILVTSSDVKIDGFTITNPSWNGVSVKGIHLYSAGPTISNITISNNIITNVDNANTKGAYGIMVQADVSNVTIEKNLISDITSAGWARGIEITPGCGVANVPSSVSITNNKITNVTVTSGTDAYDLSVDWCSGDLLTGDASQVTVEGNQFDEVKLKNLDTGHPLQIDKNWWGSTNPNFTTATGSVSADPWCITNDCSALYVAPAPTPAPTTSGGGSIVIPAISYSTGQTANLGNSTTPQVIAPVITGTGTVLGTSTTAFTRNLSYGSRGEDVSELQRILLAQGYLKLRTGLPTGWFGPLTRAALIKWQQANGVTPANGYFGPISKEKMAK